MKKLLLLIIILPFITTVLIPKASIIAGDRNRLFLIIGSGYASSNPQGPVIEIGAEVRLFGNIHGRLILDHYFGNDIEKNGETVKRMDGITLCAVYIKPVSDTIEFRLQAGGHFTGTRTKITILDRTLITSKANIGYSTGAGFTLQVGNKVYFYVETTIKKLLLQEPWTWVKGEIGIMYRLR